ncbi:MAG: GNAT family N-acetyltransferase [Alphaproteobacteria bacterium]|nr:GNAT family N-acetyltransferase [Alphaproteobacteria bacterium]MBV9905683.1 GNAT family N-acetyltransferase [Alphaproteobacteria bacterium]
MAAEIEPLAALSWPAPETLSLDGWLLRFGKGYSSRLNSVSAIRYSGTSLSQSIDAVERAYRARNLPPQFHIAPGIQPAALEAALQARGYITKPPTVLMIADASDIAAPTDVRVLASANGDFERLTREGSHSPEDGDERLETLARITDPMAFLLAMDGDNAVASAASVATGNWASVYVMRTTPAHRRRGHGRRVLATLAQWALTQNARRLYLQVDAANTPGRELYGRAGFWDAYRYLHYVPG